MNAQYQEMYKIIQSQNLDKQIKVFIDTQTAWRDIKAQPE